MRSLGVAKKVMTEEKWKASADPGRMLEYLGRKASRRKLRLFAVACCRGILSKRDEYHSALDLAEDVAEPKPLRWALRALEDWDNMVMEAGDPKGWAIQHATDPDLESLDHDFTDWVAGMRPGGKEVDPTEDLARFADLVRCVFGNPFRKVKFDKKWRTRDAVALAKTMYEKKSFDAMPILADALQDAGCADEELLDHCRARGPHCRGCWVLDLVLGK
jgi:hypothetical protein